VLFVISLSERCGKPGIVIEPGTPDILGFVENDSIIADSYIEHGVIVSDKFMTSVNRILDSYMRCREELERCRGGEQ